jgi:hypothetical protein
VCHTWRKVETMQPDVLMESEREAFVSHMARRFSAAALRGVTIKPRREEFASHMVPR